MTRNEWILVWLALGMSCAFFCVQFHSFFAAVQSERSVCLSLSIQLNADTHAFYSQIPRCAAEKRRSKLKLVAALLDPFSVSVSALCSVLLLFPFRRVPRFVPCAHIILYNLMNFNDKVNVWTVEQYTYIVSNRRGSRRMEAEAATTATAAAAATTNVKRACDGQTVVIIINTKNLNGPERQGKTAAPEKER